MPSISPTTGGINSQQSKNWLGNHKPKLWLNIKSTQWFNSYGRSPFLFNVGVFNPKAPTMEKPVTGTQSRLGKTLHVLMSWAKWLQTSADSHIHLRELWSHTWGTRTYIIDMFTYFYWHFNVSAMWYQVISSDIKWYLCKYLMGFHGIASINGWDMMIWCLLDPFEHHYL